MASVIPMAAQAGLVRHSCGELNPAEAHFCGGCGIDLIEGKTCGACGYVGTPASRFCHTCGERLLQIVAGLDAEGADRVTVVEEGLAAMRADIESLLELKEQLDAALKRVRQRQGGNGQGSSSSRSSSSTAKPVPPKPAAPAEAGETAPTLEVGRPEDSGVLVEGEESTLEPALRTLAVIHFEDRPDLQDKLQAIVAPYTSATYHPESDLADGMPDGQPLLVVNLLSGDPLAAVTAPAIRMKDTQCFTYATDGTRGFTLGVTAFFPPPFDANACATRLLGLLPQTPRVLIVSGAVLGTPELRAHLVRQGCTTSVAFDERQALGIIPSVRPNLVLIDLNLPRGDGLRLAARIRSEQPNNHVRLAFLWQESVEPALFRQHVTRAVHDFQFRDDEFQRALLHEFNPGGAAYIPNR